MNKRLLVFGIVFVLLMVGFVNASFNTVNFTATEYDTGDTLNATFYTGTGIIGTTSQSSLLGVWSDVENAFDSNISTYAQVTYTTETSDTAYLTKTFDSEHYVNDVYIKYFTSFTFKTHTLSLEYYNGSSWIEVYSNTKQNPNNHNIDTNISVNSLAEGIRLKSVWSTSDGSGSQSWTDRFYELSFNSINKTNDSITLENGTYEIISYVDDYYFQNISLIIPSSEENITIADMYNSLLTVTATDNSTGSPISTFNASIELKNGTTVDYGTTTGSINMTVLDGETYNITVSSDAAQYVTSTEEVTISGFTDSYEFNVFTFNSVRINVYDGLDNGLMSQNVTIQTISEGEQSVGSVYWPALYGDIVSFENVTSTGTILIDFLSPANYELRFISNGYNTVSKFISITDDSTQIVNTYMILNNDSDSQKVHVTNTATPLDTNYAGAIVRLQQENIGGESLYVTIQEYKTNILGNANLWVVRDASTFYRFQVIGNNRTLLTTTKTAFLPDVEETIELIIDTSESSKSIFDDDGSVTYTTVWSGVNNETFTFDWSDASSTIVGGRLLVTGQYLNVSLEEQTISDVSFVGASGTLQYTLPILNNTKYTVYAFITYSDDEKLVYSAPITFEGDILIDPNSGILIAGLVFIVTIFATYLLGPLWSGTIGFASLLLLTMLNIIILPVTIITSFIAFFFLMFVKIRRGQQ